MPNIPGIDEIKSKPTVRTRSMPPHMNQPYVDMFMLRKEKERLDKEGVRMEAKVGSVVKRLKEIERELEKLQREDKKVQKKEKFNLDKIWMRIKGIVNPEEKEEPKTETGWKIKTLKRNRKNL
ncbi:MAG: hypothetical protein MUO85_00470 [candidate division Zixibacteria bacterium]|nr:hypothetical protein [candidate division Zixibacteria bacterium]